jgi:hypothetical protein
MNNKPYTAKIICKNLKIVKVKINENLLLKLIVLKESNYFESCTRAVVNTL